MQAAFLIAALLLAVSPTRIQSPSMTFTVTATQIRSAKAVGETHQAACSPQTCRATLPVKIDTIRCVLNVLVEPPSRTGYGVIHFAAGPCEPDVALMVQSDSAQVTYAMDERGSTTATFALSFGPKSSFSDGSVGDGVSVNP